MKKIYDPIHRFITVDELESRLIDSSPFQRLRFIHQLGTAFFVYPGARHKRFEHSLGTMEVASRIFDRITSFDIDMGGPDYAYWRRILRMAALCHDLGHLPFSHCAERALLGKEGHEGWTLRIIESEELAPIWQELGPNAKEDIAKLAVGEKKYGKPFTPWEKVVSQIITDDFFGADRIDYLLRDATCSGLAYGSFDYHQLIEMLRILPWNGSTMGIEENGIDSCESLLLARHFMHRRIYQYATVKAYSFHLSRFMKTVYGNGTLTKNLDTYLSFSDNEVLAEIARAARDSSHPAHKDAASLMMQRPRQKAIALSPKVSEEQLQALSIPDLHWELSTKATAVTTMDFPVLTHEGDIVSGESFSRISIPSSSSNWAFVDPKYAGDLKQL